MNWFTGVSLFLVIWWIGLFAVLPFFARPIAGADQRSGWRGTPQQVRIGRIVAANTILAAAIWIFCYWLIVLSPLSFRSGWLGY